MASERCVLQTGCFGRGNRGLHVRLEWTAGGEAVFGVRFVRWPSDEDRHDNENPECRTENSVEDPRSGQTPGHDVTTDSARVDPTRSRRRTQRVYLMQEGPHKTRQPEQGKQPSGPFPDSDASGPGSGEP